MKKFWTAVVLAGLVLSGNLLGQAPRALDVAGAMRGRDMSVPAERAAAIEIIRNRQTVRKAAAVARARQLGIPERTIEPGGRVREVADVDEEGRILYRMTRNANAAISSGAGQIRQTAPYNLDGSSVKVGVWDEGSVRNTHQEFNTTRVVNRNAGASLNDHATHVAGTVGAAGVQASAKGMAPAVAIDSYDWNSDVAEMLAAGAVAATDASKIPISNHSYGLGTGTISGDQSYMGRYTSYTLENDNAALNTPFYLPFWAAGNAQDDLVIKGGYQSITFEALGKNTLTVGAVNDAVSGGVRAPASGTMSSFSSWGPCDDGRIKPDVVANGVGVYSTLATSDAAYASYNGTSMATPSAAGSAALLAQLYAREFSGQWMRASLLKGLLIHTADDLGNAGPDYKFGWGLINVKAAADLILAQKQQPASPKFFENNVTSSVKTRTFAFRWDGTSPIRATLSWTDPAGTAQADNSRTPNLRHNLDLRITAPDGTTVHQPYVMPFVGTWTDASMGLPARTGDNNVDNVEQVYIATPSQAGVYTMTVTLDGNLAAGRSSQVYSLIVSGIGELPSVVTGLSASALSSSAVRLTWSASSGATSYKILRDGVQVGTVTSTSFTDSGLTAATAYLYRVVASNAYGDAGASEVSSLTTPGWLDENPSALLIVAPSAATNTTNANFVFIGQAGAGLTNGITWSNALSGQTGSFARARDWSQSVPVVAGTNVVTFRAAYDFAWTNNFWDSPGNSVYASGWTSGLNGGAGFAGWNLGVNGTAGHFRATTGANTNLSSASGGSAFGLWANGGGVSTARRGFSVPLQTGSRMSVFFDNNQVTENGVSSVGFALADVAENNRFAFTFTGGQPTYRIRAANSNFDTGIGWTDAGLTITFELTAPNNYRVTVGTNSFTGELAPGTAISQLVVSNNNAGAGDSYNLYLGNIDLSVVQNWSGVAEVAAPEVVVPSIALKTDGIPDSWWQLYQVGAADRVAAGDFDGDGLYNALEYFMGTDPATFGLDGAIWFDYDAAGETASVYYRKSNEVAGAIGTVKWSATPDLSANWTTESVTDELLQDYVTWQLRRAVVPWLRDEGNDTLFIRLDVTLP